MKLDKSFLSMSAAISLLLASLTACAGSADPSETKNPDNPAEPGVDTTEKIPEEYKPPVEDLGGFELNVLNFNKEWIYWCSNEFDAEGLTGEIIDDAIYTRNRNIESAYNIKINETLERSITIDIVRTCVSAGDTTYNMFMAYDTQVPSFTEYCLDWSNVPYISFEESWWLPNAMSALNIGGRQLALTGSFTLAPYSRATCLVFNKDIYADLNFDNTPYELVDADKWTLDTLLELGRSAVYDLDGNVTMNENDRYGYFSNYKDYIANFASGCGVEWMTKDEDELLTFQLSGNEKALTLIAKLASEWEKKEFVFGNGQTVHDVKPDLFFESGHALFRISTPFNIEVLRQMDDDIGILPLPKYDTAQHEYYAPSSGIAVALLPKTVGSAEAEKLGLVMEVLSFETYRDIVPLYIEQAITVKSTRDEESMEMLEIIFDSIKFDPGLTLYLDTIANNFLNSIFLGGANVVSSSLASSQAVIDAELANLNSVIGMEQ